MEVDGDWWDGFTAERGVFFARAEDGHAWIDFHGEDDWLRPGGRTVEPTEQIEQRFLNYFPEGQLAGLESDPGLVYVAVNRGRVRAGKPACVTVYTAAGSCLVPEARLDGPVRTVVVSPPMVRPDEPLNVWLETWRVEY